ncbi:MAG: hypothetical protein N3B01_03565, partial [Verrucomicrobiae bacterium]|nr:hypothetical protein [Verrucomicrobiae bacterium]
MSDLNITLRRNFIVAIAVHAALVGTLFFTERWLSDSKKPFAAPVQLVVPADILGELPKGPGHGRGAYAPPKEAVALTHGGGGAEATPPPGTVKQTSTPQLPSPNATPSKTSVTDPDDITIPKPSAKPPKTSTPKSTPTTSPAKTTTAKTGVARSASQMASASTAPSPDQFRAGLLDALRRYGGGAGIEGGTPYGDNRPAGGG